MRVHTMRLAAAGAAAAVLVACGGGDRRAGDSAVSGRVEIDGSSTVFPISEAMAEEIGLETGGAIQVTVGQSGTGGGFKRFCTGETDISDASREIRESEVQQCAANGVEYEQFSVALDGIAVVVHADNDWVECITVDELRRIWEPGSTVRTWSDIRPEWPAQPMKLYGPGTNSGTFDYFTEAIMGEAARSRPDYTASEDDNVLVQGVSGDPGSLGYFGFAYYAENTSQLKAVALDAGGGCVEPTRQTIASGEYRPLSRPMFIYASRSALQRAEVRSFIEFYMNTAEELVPQAGYVPLDASAYQENLSRVQEFAGAE